MFLSSLLVSVPTACTLGVDYRDYLLTRKANRVGAIQISFVVVLLREEIPTRGRTLETRSNSVS